MFTTVLGTSTTQGTSLREASDTRVDQVAGAISITSVTTADSASRTDITVTGDNTGALSYRDFDLTDVLVDYINTTGDRVAKRLAYICKQLCGLSTDPGNNEWTVTGISPDTFNPNMWDPDETATMLLRVVPKIQASTTATVAVAVRGGVSDSANVSN